MKLTEFLVRTKSSTLICRLPESFGFSSAFLGRAIIKSFDGCCSVNKRRSEWRVSAEGMFSGRNFGGSSALKRDLVVSRDPKTKP